MAADEPFHGRWVPSPGLKAAPEPAVEPQPQSWECGGTAHLLPAERARASFDTNKLTFVIDGSAKKTVKKRWIWAEGEGYDNSKNMVLTRPETHRQHLQRFIEIHGKYTSFEREGGPYIPTAQEVMMMTNAARNQGAMGLHYGAFTPTLLSQGTDAQRMEWLPAAMQLKITGCLIQTELGHGSNVRGLQTTAEYDPSTEEFVLNTPTLRSMKWWPGGLGKTATHGCLYAQLLLGGVEFGFHVFVLQLRDEHHRLLPGIETGEVGPKIGDNFTETGYLRLRDVRIPRDWMLMRNQEVTAEGAYVKKGGAKKKKQQQGDDAAAGKDAAPPAKNVSQYSTMLAIRAGLVQGAGYRLAQGVAIATRYSCVRQQGFVDTAGPQDRTAPERVVMDYQNQRYRLLKQLAISYAYVFTGQWMQQLLAKAGSSGSFSLAPAGEGKKPEKTAEQAAAEAASADLMPELHASSAGLKAMCTFEAAQGLEDCRKCCGGHGVLLAAGVGAMAADYATYNTAEGDRILLELQTSKFLMKQYQAALRGEELMGTARYLASLREHHAAPADAAAALSARRCPAAAAPSAFLDLATLRGVLAHRALLAVATAGGRMAEEAARAGATADGAMNECAIDLVGASRAHCHLIIFSAFEEQATAAAAEDAAVGRILVAVCALFGCITLLENLGDVVGHLDVAQTGACRAALRQLLGVVRADVVPLMDAFEFPDNALNSALGRRDGNVYEALFSSTKLNPINDPANEPFDGYKEVLRPVLDLEFIKDHAELVRQGPIGAPAGTSKL